MFDKSTQSAVEMLHKASQADKILGNTHKTIQVDIDAARNQQFKQLHDFSGPDVVNFHYWFKWGIKDKATQTLRGSAEAENVGLIPLTPPSPKDEEVFEDQPNYIKGVLDAFSLL